MQQSKKTQKQFCNIIGLDNIIPATESEFDSLIFKLKELQLTSPPMVKAVESIHVVTINRVKSILPDHHID